MPTINLEVLAARLPPRPLTRFAPAPTGYLHLGHAVNAIHVWGLARALGGRVLLRLEDHDRSRCRPEYEAALLDDLDWLGLEPDLGTTAELRAGPSPYRQSNDDATYSAALEQLRRRATLFACDCSRRDVAAVGGDVADVETPYTGRCRDRGLEDAAGRGVRLQMDAGEEYFDDARLGPERQEPARQCGDLLLRDRLGQWTYQFAVVVDDLRHHIALVVRGEDLLSSTGRQLRLIRLLGAAAPVYLHHGLIRKPSGAKLSKADGDTGIRELRAAGVSPAAVLGRAARLAGLAPSERPLLAADLPALFGSGS